MKLYELMNTVTIQGHVEIKLFEADGEEKDSAFYENVDDLATVEIPDGWDDYEVTFLYSQRFERKHWKYVEQASLLTIEVVADE